MQMLQKVSFFILSLSEKEKKRYIILLSSIISLILAGGIYRFYTKASYIKNQIKKVNSMRREAKILLEKYNSIKKQKATVDALLTQEKNFKIKRCFEDTLKSLDLSHLMTKEPNITQTDLKEGYTEITLTAAFARTNTKQLTELLNKIEQKKRIYIKKLDITKNKNNNSLKFTITIATLQAHLDVSENLE